MSILVVHSEFEELGTVGGGQGIAAADASMSMAFSQKMHCTQVGETYGFEPHGNGQLTKVLIRDVAEYLGRRAISLRQHWKVRHNTCTL